MGRLPTLLLKPEEAVSLHEKSLEILYLAFHILRLAGTVIPILREY